MKIMLLTAATGGGHLRAAAAVEQYIRENTSYEVKTVDTLKAIGKFLDKTVCDSYLFMAKKTPTLFGRLYKQTNKENLFSGLVPKRFHPVVGGTCGMGIGIGIVGLIMKAILAVL